MLRYGLPLIPGLVALWATAYADRLLLANIEDLDAVGLYAIAARFAAPVMLLLIGVRHRLPPVPAVPAARRARRWSASCAGAWPRWSPSRCWLPGCRSRSSGPSSSTSSRPATTTRPRPSARWCSGTAAYGVAVGVRLAPMLIHRRTRRLGRADRRSWASSTSCSACALIPPFGAPRRGAGVVRRLRAAGGALLVVGPARRRRAVRARPAGGRLRAGRRRRRGVAHRPRLRSR